MLLEVVCAFTPASIGDCEAGHYLQFNPWESVTTDHATRELELNFIRWQLFFRLAAETAGTSRPHTMARVMCSSTDSFPAVKQRFSRMCRRAR